jgi:hypothetical protein
MPFDVGRFTCGDIPGKAVGWKAYALLLVALILSAYAYGVVAALAPRMLSGNAGRDVLAVLVTPLGAAIAAIAAFYCFIYLTHRLGLDYLVALMGFAYGGAILLLFVLGIPQFILLLVCGAIFLLYYLTRGFAEQKLAERLIKASTRIMLEERELLLPPLAFFLVVSYLFTGYMALMVSQDFVAFARGPGGKTELIIHNFPGAALVTFLFLAVDMALFHVAMGMVVGITYIWYRGEDPRLRDGVNLVLKRLDNIVSYSICAAFYYTLMVFVSGRGRGGKAVSRVMGFVWGVINYFTLQTLVVTGKRPMESINLSFELLRKNIPDVLYKEVFVGRSLNGVSSLLHLPVLVVATGLFMQTRDPLPLFFWLFYASVVIVAVYCMELIYNTLLFSWALERHLGLKPGAIPAEMGPIVGLIESHGQSGKSGGDLWAAERDERERRVRGQAGISRGEEKQLDWSFMFKDRKPGT